VLHGVRVLDFGRYIAGPYCAALLGEYGAEVIRVERLGKDKGAAVEFTEVLLVNQDGQVTIDSKALASAKVTGEVVAERRGAKVLVVKFKRRKNYRRHRGHRQTMTAVRITKIEV